jgi:hypothetical protein
MTRWLGVRFWIALLAGTAAGLFAWSLPPYPTASIALDADGVQLRSLRAISSDGHYLVATGKKRRGSDEADPGEAIVIWDRRQLGKSAPLVVPIQASHRWIDILFSPDEKLVGLIVCRSTWECDLTLHEIATGKKLEQWSMPDEGVAVFAPEGKLLFIMDGNVIDPATRTTVRRLQETIDDLAFVQPFGELAIYSKEEQTKVYSWTRREVLAEFPHATSLKSAWFVSRDAKVLVAYCDEKPRGRHQKPIADVVLLDAVTKSAYSASELGGAITSLSPDGEHIVRYGESRRHRWIEKLWPTHTTTVVAHWRSKQELARFADIAEVRFSPQGNLLALRRDDGVIDIYDFPFPTPWLRILLTGTLAAATTWSLAWLWSRWRARKTPVQEKTV